MRDYREHVARIVGYDAWKTRSDRDEEERYGTWYGENGDCAAEDDEMADPIDFGAELTNLIASYLEQDDGGDEAVATVKQALTDALEEINANEGAEEKGDDEGKEGEDA